MGLLDYVFIHRIFLAFTLMQEKKNNRTRNYLFILGSIPEQNNNSIYPAVYYWYYKYKIVNFEWIKFWSQFSENVSISYAMLYDTK